jgi:Plavaka transposase
MLIAYIPHVLFLEHKSIRTTLTSRLYHQCLEIVIQSLIQPGRTGVEITDAAGNVRLGFPLVAGHIGDLPELQLVSICAKYSSPFTTAGFHDLGDSVPRRPRTSRWIISKIEDACRQADPEDVEEYQAAASQLGLNGVHLPFWRDLPHYQVGSCVCPDILHGVLRFWRDHPLQWSLPLVGEEEYDRRLRSLQPVSGYRHFRAGIQHLSQWTGREDRELLRTHVALICGPPKVSSIVIRNQRAFCDFAYLVQYQSHNETTLGYVETALGTFHSTKHVYIQLGVRKGKKGVINHFNIPKLNNLLQFVPHIREMGSSPQFSTEIVETLHRSQAKVPYRSTNRKDYVRQMCNRLDCAERIAHRLELIQWCRDTQEQARREAMFQLYTPRYRQILASRYDEYSQEHDPKQVVPLKTRISQSRLWLALKPYRHRQDVITIAHEYQLEDFSSTLRTFLQSCRHPEDDLSDLEVRYIDVWRKLRIRTVDVQDDEKVTLEHAIQAEPPSPLLPYGRCHCVLIHVGNDVETTGLEGEYSLVYFL